MENKIKESKRRYGKIYNKTNITVQLNRELINDHLAYFAEKLSTIE